MKIEYTKEREKGLTFDNLVQGDVFVFIGESGYGHDLMMKISSIKGRDKFVCLSKGISYIGDSFSSLLESQPVRLVDAKLVVDEAEPIED